MSMLAEPRRKQKWTLNPRGKQWSEDSNKFGQKMLERMGWTSGKGLGANEQGMTEHVKVNYKNNQSGIGFKDRGDQWTQHQADFNDFLSQLKEQNSNSNSDAANEIKNVEEEQSLELKSKQSRARVHYHKFTRGKDVKKYSAKDLANIFGKKDLKDACKAPKAEETLEEISAEPTGSKDNRGGVLTIKGGNIDEYFKNKLPNFIKNGNSNEADEPEGEYEPRLGFGFNSVIDSERSHAHEDNIVQIKSTKRKRDAEKTVSGFAFANNGLDLDYQESERDAKKKSGCFAYENPSLSLENGEKDTAKSMLPFSNEGFVNPALNINDSTNDDNNGAEFEVSRVEFGLDNTALDLSDENNRKRRVTFNDKVEYNTDVVKKKKKRKGNDKLDKFEVDNSKLKKKAREITSSIEITSNSEVEGFINEALEIEGISDEINDNELNERKTKKSKRKKNRRLSSLETIEETVEENSQIDESALGEAVLLDETSQKKSKKPKKNHENGEKLESNSENAEIQIEALEVKKKDKRERKIVIQEESNNSEKKSDKKKGKTKKIDQVEPTILAEISRKITKSKKNKVGNEPKRCEGKEDGIKSKDVKKKDKKRSKSKIEGKDNTNIEIEFEEANDQIDIEKSGTGIGRKRKSNGGENGLKLSKKSKLAGQAEAAQTEDTENVFLEQNSGNISLSSIKKPRKSIKSFFNKAPTLYFSGSNINEMPGYGVAVMEVKE